MCSITERQRFYGGVGKNLWVASIHDRCRMFLWRSTFQKYVAGAEHPILKGGTRSHYLSRSAAKLALPGSMAGEPREPFTSNSVRPHLREGHRCGGRQGANRANRMVQARRVVRGTTQRRKHASLSESWRALFLDRTYAALAAAGCTVAFS
jgi:hypothetical protein